MSKSCSCCISLRSATLGSALMSLIFAMSMITASATSIFYQDTMNAFVLVVFLVNGIADFVSSVLCLRGVVTESGNYLLPWIFTISIGTIFMFLISISYMMSGLNSHTIFGVILFVIAMLFSAAWICVLSYYYQLYDKKQRRTQRAARINANTEISATSVSSVALDDYRAPPPPYNIIFKDSDPAFSCNDDKLPSYEEAFVGANRNQASVENGRF